MAVFADVDGADPIQISDEAYNATTWNDSLNGATKNALRDKFEATDALITSTINASISDTVYGAGWDGVTTIAPSKNAVYDKIQSTDASITAITNVVTFTDVVSDVNRLEVVDSATGNPVQINATGTDSNINLKLSAKGTGYIYRNTYKWVTPISATATDVSTGDGKAVMKIPIEMNGTNIASVRATLETAGTTGTQDIQIARIRSGSAVDVLSTKLTIDSTETTSDTAATAAVINVSNDDMATDDTIRIDVDAAHTTAGKGGYVEIVFRLP
jgi:hypothetical protein